MLCNKTGIQQRLRTFFANEGGATAVEYGLIIAIISGALILGLEGVRDNLQAVFQIIIDTIAAAMA